MTTEAVRRLVDAIKYMHAADSPEQVLSARNRLQEAAMHSDVLTELEKLLAQSEWRDIATDPRD